MKKGLHIVFIAAVLSVVTIGLGTTLFGNKEINEYENRYAEKIEELSLKGYMDSSFQDSMELALSDRVNFAENMKKCYNDVKSAFMRFGVENTKAENEDKYLKIGDKNLFGDEGNIVFNTSVYAYLEKQIDKRVDQYNRLVKKYPEVDFYLYYVEKDTDINFETGEKVGVFESLYEKVNFPKENMTAFEINSFEEFKERFYKTDHHWNYKGADIGYREVLELLAPGEKPIEHGEEVKISDNFSGSKATGELAGYSEAFFGYTYTVPKMKITINGFEAEGYGNEEKYLSLEGEDVNYVNFYGMDMGEIIFETGRKDKENILIIGESYDNAILELLATHFNRTHSIDLRNYSAYMNKDFDFGAYIKKHDIDKVLMIGNVDYIILDDFIVEE